MSSLLYRDLTFVPSLHPEKYETVIVRGFPLAVHKTGFVWDFCMGKEICTYKDKDGYLIANKAGVSIKMHRLMLMVYEGAPDYGMECRHLNGNPSDNNIANLVWGSKKDNRADRLLHGTHNARTDHGRTSFTEADIEDIKARLLRGERLIDISNLYGVTSGTISHIKQKRTWN